MKLHSHIGNTEEIILLEGSPRNCQSSFDQSLGKGEILNSVFGSVPVFKKLRYNLLYNVVLVFAVQQSESVVCIYISGFPGGAVVKNQSTMQETPEVCVGSSLEKETQPSPVFFPGKSHGQRSLAGYSPWSHKEPHMTERLSTTHHTVLCTLLMIQFYTIKNVEEKTLAGTLKDKE